MKRTIKRTLLLLFVFTQLLSVQANNILEPNEEKNQSVELKGDNPRPRGDVYIPTCYYIYIGRIHIIAESSITDLSAVVTRLDDNQQWNGTAVGNVLSVEVSTAPGTYYIELTLSDGSVYYGEYIL